MLRRNATAEQNYARGLTLRDQGQYAAGLRHLRLAFGQYRAEDKLGYAAHCLLEMGNCQLALGHLSAASGAYREAEESFTACGLPVAPECLLGLARVAEQRGPLEDAAAGYAAAAQAWWADDEMGKAAPALFSLGNVCCALGQLDNAQVAYQMAEQAYATVDDISGIARCRGAVSGLDPNAGPDAEPSGTIDESAVPDEPVRSTPSEIGIAHIRQGRGVTLLRRGQFEEALAVLEVAKLEFVAGGAVVDAAHCQLGIATAYREMERSPEAVASFEEAERLFAAGGQPAEASKCRHRAATLAQRSERLLDDSHSSGR